MRVRATAVVTLFFAALTACVSVVSLEDAGVRTDSDSHHEGWVRVRSLRYGVSFALPGRPFVRQQVDDARMRREGAVLALVLDQLHRRELEIRLFRYQRDDDAARVLQAWSVEMLERLAANVESEDEQIIGGQPGILARLSGVGPNGDGMWVVAVSDGRSVLEIDGRNLPGGDEEPPAELLGIVEAIAFGR